MDDIADYLIENYFPYYTGHDLLASFDRDKMLKFLAFMSDRIIVIRDDKIKGVAIFLTLKDDTYNALGCIDMNNVMAMDKLLQEHGDNIHFILLAADSQKTILRGIKEAKQRKPRSISWWNPETTRLHKYNLGG